MWTEARALWRFRYFVFLLTTRNIKLKYEQSVLGLLWTLINPVAVLLILLAVFTNIVRIGIDDFWAFLLSGYFVYHFVNQAVMANASIFAQFAVMIQGVAVPKSAPIIAAVLAKFAEFLIEFALCLILIAVFRHGYLPVSILIVPLLLVLMVALVLGTSLALATLSVFYTDVKHMLPIALTALFYISPVVYPISRVPEDYRALYLLNPLATLLNLFHTAVYLGQWPAGRELASCVLAVVLVFLFGAFIFARYESDFAEVA